MLSHSLPSLARRAALFLLPGLAALGLAGPADAIPVPLVLDPAQSSLTPQAGAPAALSGTLALDLGALPPLVANTSFDLTDVSVSGGGLTISLDPDLANPGLGVLMPGGAFLFPTLFLRIDDGSTPFDQSVVNVTGSFGPSAACGGATCFETSFDVDTGGPQGIVTVDVVASVPEPCLGLLLWTGCAALAGARTRRTR